MPRQILAMTFQSTKFENLDPSFRHSKDRSPKIQNGSRDSNHAHFRIVCHLEADICYSLCTKCQDFSFICSRNTKKDAKQ